MRILAATIGGWQQASSFVMVIALSLFCLCLLAREMVGEHQSSAVFYYYSTRYNDDSKIL